MRNGVRKLRPGVDCTLHPLVHGEQPVQLLAGVVEPAPDDVPHKRAGTMPLQAVADDFLDFGQRETKLLCRANEVQALELRSREELIPALGVRGRRSEEHTSELQSPMRISYAVFCLKKKTKKNKHELHK